ncbi:Starch-binding associating with outer membrane [Mariniphaga anaerophila]|uniref:Starch-binding associating with outer membrane n=1 Tax=Mariniphaga anaerophila TaxID=1484053 RepID=A0A1M4UBI0_9BACT|nr:RagB/SusD family nutrient uptake outer membrane protein [Mariniphaga anaerophila]SHE53998.1 Starch-binding associating with outer membrane [Mariniphaga anaerophila]
MKYNIMQTNKKSGIKLIVLLFCVMAFFSSCNDDFLEKLPTDAIATDAFFKTQSDFEQGVTAIYSSLRDVYGDAWIVGEMRSDNTHFVFDPSDRGAENYERYADFIDISTDGATRNKYKSNYQVINRANQVLYRIEDVEFDSSVKNSLIGQALFLRAFAYFDLVKNYGGVPMFLAPVQTYVDAFLTRASAEEVYSRIISDTQEAINLLPAKSNENMGRVSKGAAQTLLGDVYMNLKRYADAETVLKQISGYQLLNNYADVFSITNKNNAESIFEIQYKQGASEGFSNSFFYTFLPRIKNTAVITGVDGQPNGGWKGNAATPDLINCFEENDPRLEVNIGYVSTTELYFPFSYEVDSLPYCNKYNAPHTTFKDVGTNWPVYRYAEVLLFLAEISNELNKPAEALQYLNQVRTRVGLSNVTETEQGALREIIAKERRTELAFENKRWDDLVRTGKAIETMNAYGQRIKDNPGVYYYPEGVAPLETAYNVTEHRLLLPIPQSEIDINSELVQNPGY